MHSNTITALRTAVLLSISFCLATSNSDSPWRDLQLSEDSLFCHVVRSEVISEEEAGGDEESESEGSDLSCLTKRPHRSYREAIPLNLPIAFIMEHDKYITAGRLGFTISVDFLQTGADGMPEIEVPSKYMDQIQVSIMDGDSASGHGRQLSKELRSGTKRLLAVRISALEGSEEPVETATEIRDAIFGSEDLPKALPTVVSQYAAVSRGALQFVASSGVGISDGVAEISISNSVVNGSRSIQGNLMQEILDATALALGDLETVADRIVFCIPTGSLLNNSPKWTAFTYRYEPYSFYQKSRCTKLSVTMHEIGHSNGFSHSGKGSDVYLDEQGYMGYANNKQFGPQKGFNAHKHWISGWFDDRSIDIEENLLLHGALGAPLVAFADASNENLPENEVVVLKIGDLYIQYNKAKGYNSGTYIDQKDKVTVNYAESEDDVSDLVGELAPGETYIHPSFDEAGHDLIIQVCSLGAEDLADIDYAVVSIHLDNGFQTSLCGDTSIVRNNWRTFDAQQEETADADQTGVEELKQINVDSVVAETPSSPVTVSVDDADEDTTEEKPADTSVQQEPAKDEQEIGDSGSYNPYDLEQDTSDSNQEQKEVFEETRQGSGSSILVIAIAAGCVSIMAGLAVLWLCSRRTTDSIEADKTSTEKPSISKPPKKVTKETLDKTDTDCSDRSYEDGVIEVKMLPPTSDDYIDAERFIEW